MRSALAVWGALLVGAAGALVALDGRGSEDPFKSAQSRALTRPPQLRMLSAARVEAGLAHAPEPIAGAVRTPAVHVRCASRGGGPLRNPWQCAVLYRSGVRAHYLVQVQPDGSYSGVGSWFIHGCCIRVPTLD